jgi:hypothetical protein
MQHNIFNDQYFSTENASCIENHNVSQPSSDICSAVLIFTSVVFYNELNRVKHRNLFYVTLKACQVPVEIYVRMKNAT